MASVEKILETVERVADDKLPSSKTSLSRILELLAQEPGQSMRFKVANASMATQVKRNRGYEARTTKLDPPDPTGKFKFWMYAVYKGPDYQAEIRPRERKEKEIFNRVPLDYAPLLGQDPTSKPVKIIE